MESRRWNDAGKTFNAIINDGKLDSTDTGQAWMLLGIVRHETHSLDRARAAFQQAKKYRKTANGQKRTLGSAFLGGLVLVLLVLI